MEFRHPVNRRHARDDRPMGARIADVVAARVGSWPFILIQSSMLLGWVIYNGFLAVRVLRGGVFDPFPFILLNLVLSFQAAYTGPIVMMSQNRASARDREMAEHDYRVNEESLALLRWQADQLSRLAEAAGVVVEPPPTDRGPAG